MFNIKKIPNGINFNELDYLIEGNIEILGESQCHIQTDKGVILLDLSCIIDGQEYTDINLFIQNLY